VSSSALPDGYAYTKRIHSGNLSDVYTAVREVDGHAVVLKQYSIEATEHEAPRHEWDALRLLAGPGVPRAIDLYEDAARPVLVLDHVPGIPVARWARLEPPSLTAVLRVAVQIADIVGRVHAARLIHRDLNPWNVLVDPLTLSAHVIDFGLSRRLGSVERTGFMSSGAVEGSLRYIAPEQTGRMNRGCDARSDLYSLGATLYFALVGRPPFDAKDPLELIHSHLAKRPPVVSEGRPDVPRPVSDLVAKLLAKEPEERYQSATGLVSDLRALEAELRGSGRIPDTFVLAAADAQTRPRFSAKLYGREDAIARVAGAYARACAGEPQILVVEGDAGSGKSALVETLRPLLAETGGYLAVGKLDLYRDRANAGWAAVVDSLAHQLLLESDANLAAWRERLRASLGNIAGVLAEVAPGLAFVIGDVPPAPALAPRETRARFALAIARFIDACATREHPLVLFIDDVQWSDASTRALLEEVAADPSPGRALLLICAYRSEARESRHIRRLIERFEARSRALDHVTIGPLSTEHAALMLADALGRTADETRELARWVERKTHNGPLMIRQFVDYLHTRGLLHFEVAGGWQWDADAIAAEAVPDDAVALLTAKLHRLTATTRDVASLASCAGDEFDADMIAELAGRDCAEIAEALFVLSDEGLTTPCTRGFRFAHDRIREAAQALLSDEARAKLHAGIAKLLLCRMSGPERAQRVFEIVEHLNRGAAHIGSELRRDVLVLNREAGVRALGGGHAHSAEVYLSRALAVHAEADWAIDRAGSLELHLQGAEAALQRADFETAAALLDAVEPHATAVFDRARVVAKRISLWALTGDPLEAVEYALATLREHGVRWSIDPSRLRARLAIEQVRREMGGDDIDVLLRPAQSPSLERLAPMLILHQSSALMVLSNTHLAMLATCYCMRDHLRGGYVRDPGFLVAVYAMYEFIFLRDPDRARCLARSALAWAEHGDPVTRPQTEMTVHLLLYPFLVSRRMALRPAPRIAAAFEEIGDTEWVVYSRLALHMFLGLAGDDIEATETKLRELHATLASESTIAIDVAACFSALAMLRSTDAPARITSAVEAAPHLRPNRGRNIGAITLWMQTLCVWGRHDLAFELSERVGAWLERASPWVHVVDHTFYRGLAAATLAGRARWPKGARYRRALLQCLRTLRRWARVGPDFEHMVLLLDAERARLRGRPVQAGALYEGAGRRARRQQFAHHAALAHECRARMLVDLRRPFEAQAAANEAASAYAAWGTQAKADALRRELGAGS
jgi:predicted ATPase